MTDSIGIINYERISMTFLGNADNGQQMSLNFADVLNSGGTLIFKEHG